MLFSADNITAAEKTALRACLNTTANIAGCQAIRKRIGHCCFGMRVVYGEVIFVTVSPGRRHSSMILKLSRARRNDTSLQGDDAVKRARRKFSGKDLPKIFSETCYIDDVDGERVSMEIPLPPLFVRQACNWQVNRQCIGNKIQSYRCTMVFVFFKTLGDFYFASIREDSIQPVRRKETQTQCAAISS